MFSFILSGLTMLDNDNDNNNNNNKHVQFEDDLIVVIPSPDTITQLIAGSGDLPSDNVSCEGDEEEFDDSILYYTKDELLDLQDEIDFLLDHVDSLQQQKSICWRGLEDAKKRKDFRFLYRNQVLDRHDELRKQRSSILSGDSDPNDDDGTDPVNSLQVFAVTLSMESQEEARKRAIQDAEDAL